MKKFRIALVVTDSGEHTVDIEADRYQVSEGYLYFILEKLCSHETVATIASGRWTYVKQVDE